MKQLCLEVLQMSINASYLIVFVILLRYTLKKAPKNYRILLWLLVGIRLLCPFSFPSAFSLIPNTNISDNLAGNSTQIYTDYAQTHNITLHSSIDSSKIELMDILSILWIIGVISLFIYGIYSYYKIYKLTKASTSYKDNVYFCDYIPSPFILGFAKPKVYLPSGIKEEQIDIILKHEYTHIHRKDHLTKPFSYFILSLHWFNPLVWISYKLFCEDIELSCDEKVISEMTLESKKNYSTTLLECSSHSFKMLVCPVAFGESDVKNRVKSILNYKKPAFWILAICIIISIFAIITLMSDSSAKGIHVVGKVIETDYNGVIIEENGSNRTFIIKNEQISKSLLSKIKEEDMLKVYYNGVIKESLPAQFDVVYNVTRYADFSFSPDDDRDAVQSKAIVNEKHDDHIVVTTLKDYERYKIDIKLSNFFAIQKLKEGDCVILSHPEKFITKDYWPEHYLPIYDIYLDNEQYTVLYDNNQNVIGVLSKNDTFTNIYNKIMAYDCGITDEDYKGKSLCTHPRGFYKNEHITIKLRSEPHIYFTYIIDIYDPQTTATSRIYIKQENAQKILDMIEDANIPYVGD